jgi:hypothetical protein
MEFTSVESSRSEDLVVFSKGIGIPAGRRSEHGQGKRRGCGRGDAIGIGNEFQSHRPPTRRKRGKSLGRQLLAGRYIEMVQEIRQQHDVVSATPISIERTAGKQSMAICDTRLLRVLGGHGKHIRPVECTDRGLGVLLRDRDSEQTVPRRHIQNAAWFLIIGPMARANATQTGLSYETVPSSETAVPPRFTAFVN